MSFSTYLTLLVIQNSAMCELKQKHIISGTNGQCNKMTNLIKYSNSCIKYKSKYNN